MQSIKYRTALLLGMTCEVCGALFLGEHKLQISTLCAFLGDPGMHYSTGCHPFSCCSAAAPHRTRPAPKLGCWTWC